MDKDLLIKFIQKARDKKRLTRPIKDALEEAGLKDEWKSMPLKAVASKLAEHFDINPLGVKQHFKKS